MSPDLSSSEDKRMRQAVSTPQRDDAIVMSRSDYVRLARLIEIPRISVPERVLDFLVGELDRAIIVDQNVPERTLAVGDRATVFEPDTQIERTVELVWPGEESYPERISVLTAFGSALIGLSEGQSIRYETLDGRPKQLTLLKVHRQPSFGSPLDPQQSNSGPRGIRDQPDT
jgi:regulator of nucleoside diphosphate kinase